MLLRVDPGSSVPLYEQIAAALRRDIANGALAAGERLPTARDVANSLGVNLHTVLRAYQDLRDEGLIDMRRGRGAVVAAGGGSATQITAEIAALVTKARAAGVSDETVLSLVRSVQQATR